MRQFQPGQKVLEKTTVTKRHDEWSYEEKSESGTYPQDRADLQDVPQCSKRTISENPHSFRTLTLNTYYVQAMQKWTITLTKVDRGHRKIQWIIFNRLEIFTCNTNLNNVCWLQQPLHSLDLVSLRISSVSAGFAPYGVHPFEFAPILYRVRPRSYRWSCTEFVVL